jgi:hypothetical protein
LKPNSRKSVCNRRTSLWVKVRVGTVGISTNFGSAVLIAGSGATASFSMTATDAGGDSLAIFQLSKRAHPDASKKHVGIIAPYLVMGGLLFHVATEESKPYAES